MGGISIEFRRDEAGGGGGGGSISIPRLLALPRLVIFARLADGDSVRIRRLDGLDRRRIALDPAIPASIRLAVGVPNVSRLPRRPLVLLSIVLLSTGRRFTGARGGFPRRSIVSVALVCFLLANLVRT